MERITYWLYWGDQIITSVRGDLGMREDEIIRKALENEYKVPLSGMPYYEFEYKINQCEIKTYPNGR